MSKHLCKSGANGRACPFRGHVRHIFHLLWSHICFVFCFCRRCFQRCHKHHLTFSLLNLVFLLSLDWQSLHCLYSVECQLVHWNWDHIFWTVLLHVFVQQSKHSSPAVLICVHVNSSWMRHKHFRLLSPPSVD